MNSKRRQSICLLVVALAILPVDTSYGRRASDFHDFSSASVVIADQQSQTEQAAVEMLIEETEARTGVRLAATSQWPDTSVPVIALGTASWFKEHYGPFDQSEIEISASEAPEGFSIKFLDHTRDAPTLLVIGNDTRGMLFGAGYFLRNVYMHRGKLLVPDELGIVTHPEIPLRGHQLGYRPKTNSYDGFTIDMWEQYIRDLIVFGTNTVELVPPNTDDASYSPMFPLPQMEMMVKMDKLLARYGLNVWIWYPLMHGDYSKPEIVKESLEENERIFSKLPRIDAIFIPGGDPGHQHPKLLFEYLEKEAKVLHKYHPDAEIWVSPQGFSQSWMGDFYSLVEKAPEWLTGIVYGPNVRFNVEELRKIIPDSLPIRRYPDITHNLDSLYPVLNWDYAYAATEGRESINPRPRHQEAIFNAFSPDDYAGFITYSEGVNDDVNKMIWSALGWNPDADVVGILRDYSRYFVGPKYEDDFAQGLLDLEENWKGSLLENRLVYSTLGKFQAMEESASPGVLLDWRFQMALFRAYYDAYVRSRLLYETQLQDQALSVLRRAPQLGSTPAMEQAEEILDRTLLSSHAPEWRQRLYELGAALFQSIRMQKSVDKYFAISVRRGANLDQIDFPLNDRLWLEDQFSRIRGIGAEDKRLEEIAELVNWENPGPGGFYDDLGSLDNQPHIVKAEMTYGSAPSLMSSPFIGFAVADQTRDWRVSWRQFMQRRYDQPLKMQYSNLDPDAEYEVKVTYTGNAFTGQVFDVKIRLLADENVVVHPYRKKPLPIEPLTFDVPQEATDDGELTLKWNIQPREGGEDLGCQVGEVWLMKKEQRIGNFIPSRE